MVLAHLRMMLVLAAIIPLTACSGTKSSLPPSLTTPTSTHRALLIGTAAGTVYNALSAQFQVDTGTTGNLSPNAYDLVIFDGNTMTPQAIAASGAVTAFVRAGKAVVLLNNTEAHRSIGLAGAFWGHIQGSSPGTMFFVERNAQGVPDREVDLEFPLHAVAVDSTGSSGPPKMATRAPTATELTLDAQRWVAGVARRLSTPLGATATATATGDPTPIPLTPTSNIVAATASVGQTAYGLDVVQPLSVTFLSILDTIAPPSYMEFCGNVLSVSNTFGSCNPTTNPTIPSPPIYATAETMINVLLEPNGLSFQHKIIERHYAFISTAPFPVGDSAWEYGYVMADNANGVNTANAGPYYTTIGFNEAINLSSGPTWTPALVMVSNQPANANNTTQLQTSYDHTEEVGVSATAGYAGKQATGTVGVNWSDSWSWTAASTVSIQNWETSFTASGQTANYLYDANAGTPNTFSALQNAAAVPQPPILNRNNPIYEPPANDNLVLGNGSGTFNALQSTSIQSQDETEWLSVTPVAPAQETFASTVEFYSGEVFQMPPQLQTNGPQTYNYGNLGITTVNMPIAIDFSNPSLQPPAAAPWTLSFSPYTRASPGYVQTTGTLTLNSANTSPTTVNITYVVQPQTSLATLPIGAKCAGNTTSFIPSSNVISSYATNIFNNQPVGNGPPPVAITVPAGARTVSFPLVFQTFNAAVYNVQIVAWLPSLTLNGTTVTNPQYAACLTPPNTPL